MPSKNRIYRRNFLQTIANNAECISQMIDESIANQYDGNDYPEEFNIDRLHETFQYIVAQGSSSHPDFFFGLIESLAIILAKGRLRMSTDTMIKDALQDTSVYLPQLTMKDLTFPKPAAPQKATPLNALTAVACANDSTWFYSAAIELLAPVGWRTLHDGRLAETQQQEIYRRLQQVFDDAMLFFSPWPYDGAKTANKIAAITETNHPLHTRALTYLQNYLEMCGQKLGNDPTLQTLAELAHDIDALQDDGYAGDAAMLGLVHFYNGYIKHPHIQDALALHCHVTIAHYAPQDSLLAASALAHYKQAFRPLLQQPEARDWVASFLEVRLQEFARDDAGEFLLPPNPDFRDLVMQQRLSFDAPTENSTRPAKRRRKPTKHPKPDGNGD